MEKSRVQDQIVHTNFSSLKYIILIALGFSVFFLLSDFVFHGEWNRELLSLYRILDIVYTFIVVLGLIFFWFLKIQKLSWQKLCSAVFPFLILLWSAIVTGIDFQVFGLSTFLIVLLTFSFFLYLNPITSSIYFISSCFVLLATIYISRGTIDNFVPLMLLLIPIIIFSILMTIRNYKNLQEDLLSKHRIVEMNRNLMYTNENLEKEVEKRTREIQNALERAEESDRLKTAFLHNMSHEIRTPMNAIIGFSKMLEKRELSVEKRKSFITIILNSCNQLLSIVTDILTISSINTRQEKLNIEEFCINDMMVDLLAIFKMPAYNQNVSLFAKQGLNDSQSKIYTDKTKITQILTNLISNALKFTHEGFVEFGYELISDPVGCLSSRTIRFYVKDSGIGIEPGQQEKIFEHFRQADFSMNRKYGGTGLGLSISKGFIDLLGGKIWVESVAGKGSTFYFTIPFEPVNEYDDTGFDKFSMEKDVKRVLVVEDDEYNYLLIEELLIQMGLSIIHSNDGYESIELCRQNPNISLVLMDIKLPKLDGHSAAKQIKEFHPNLPIIAQTAYALEDEISKFSGTVFDDYMTKPINEDEFREKVMKYLDKLH
jgi:signal transduction histidine kinase/ActR/RegA family two-component response regulator